MSPAKKLNLDVGIVARQDPRGVEVERDLTAELEVELVAESLAALENGPSLLRQLRLGVEALDRCQGASLVVLPPAKPSTSCVFLARSRGWQLLALRKWTTSWERVLERPDSTRVIARWVARNQPQRNMRSVLVIHGLQEDLPRHVSGHG